MCGRFAVDDEVNEMIAEFVWQTGARPEDWRPGWVSSYNVAPTQQIPVLVETLADRHDPASAVIRRAEAARWSLIPGWSRDGKLKFPTFNARAETAGSQSIWKDSVVSRRALVPAAGYYEWKTEGKRKTPYFIRHPEHPIAFAGLYSWWKGTGEWQLTASILTMPASDQLEWIHPRNPMPLPHEAWDWWLDPTAPGDQRMVDEAVRMSQAQAQQLIAHEVAPLSGDGPSLIEPVNSL
ncbi:SOS response-associated peptidase [Ruicaihuangia caeni]|uniref:Abasic site processing protein n=1 Tax=Ruicaihuangia caeni TaxID=3042517 RepID=A0AAW6T6L1_9MICO|nr:SOS response-associated peptidase [Klugiella sp. YN-L-19]MDI2097793.1 SOS response-associated peptidase [Klugiella sp. YN-L-19]